jgi:hypothetical protein
LGLTTERRALCVSEHYCDEETNSIPTKVLAVSFALLLAGDVKWPGKILYSMFPLIIFFKNCQSTLLCIK